VGELGVRVVGVVGGVVLFAARGVFGVEVAGGAGVHAEVGRVAVVEQVGVVDEHVGGEADLVEVGVVVEEALVGVVGGAVVDGVVDGGVDLRPVLAPGRVRRLAAVQLGVLVRQVDVDEVLLLQLLEQRGLVQAGAGGGVDDVGVVEGVGVGEAVELRAGGREGAALGDGADHVVGLARRVPEARLALVALGEGVAGGAHVVAAGEHGRLLARTPHAARQAAGQAAEGSAAEAAAPHAAVDEQAEEQEGEQAAQDEQRDLPGGPWAVHHQRWPDAHLRRRKRVRTGEQR